MVLKNSEVTVVSRVVAAAGGKSYLEVGGAPVLYNSVQAWKAPAKEFMVENYAANMDKAQQVGYRLFTFWLAWRDLEPRRSEYEWRALDEMIDRANELDMYLDVVWGGSNFCAHLDVRFAPDWLLDWDDVHLKDSDGKTVACISDDYGHGPALDHTNREALEVEKEMLRRLIRHLQEYDKNQRVVFIQVLNEPNHRNWTYQDKKNILSYANELASVIKTSNYQIATRMNLQGQRMDSDLEMLEYIDCHGADPYSEDVELIRALIQTPTKMPYIAENAAYTNTTSLMITSFANGGGYNVYMLGPCLVMEKPGVYGQCWQPWEVTYGVYNLNAAVNRIDWVIAVAPPSDMVDFNTEENEPQPNYEAMKHLNGHDVGMRTWGEGSVRNGAVGMTVHHDGYFYLLADRVTWFLFKDEPVEISSGGFDSDRKWVENFRIFWDEIQEGYQVPYHAGECLRVKLR